MLDRSPLDVIKPEVRAARAYSLKYLEAEVKLDQNENPFEIPQALKDRVLARFAKLKWNRYPEFVPTRITGVLSSFAGWNPEGILVGNGSNELILATLVATAGPGRTVAIPQPTFTLYRLLSGAMGARVVDVALTDSLEFDRARLAEAASNADVTIICSPNNPTGSLLAHEDLVHVLESARGLVVVDEAYHEFSGQSVVPMLEHYPNLVVLRTFSKAMAMAGLRFGYLLAQPALVSEIEKVKLPYNVNVFTLAAVEAVVGEREALDGSIAALIDERARVAAGLSATEGVETFPSHANFVLFRTRFDAAEVFENLYAHGVLVRNVSHYHMLERSLRVTIGTVEQNDRFLVALGRVLEALA